MVIPTFFSSLNFSRFVKTPSKLVAGLNFLQFYIGNCDPAKKNFLGGLFWPFSSLLAQLSGLLPPVLVVETPHVAVHVLFHSRIEASIRLASTAQAFWPTFFQMRPDFGLSAGQFSLGVPLGELHFIVGNTGKFD